MTTMMIGFFSDSFRGFTQSLLNPLFSIYSMVLFKIIGIAITVYILSDYKLLAIPIGLLISELFIMLTNGIYSYIQFKRMNIKVQINYEIFNEYKNNFVNLFGLKIGNEILNNSQPILITIFLNPEITTAYTITKRAIDVILTFLNIVVSSLLSPLSHLVGEHDQEKIKKTIVKAISLFSMISLLLFSVYIYSNHTFVSLWIGKDIVLSQNIIFFMGLSGFVFIMTRFMRGILFSLDKIKFASNMVFFEGIIFLLTSTILIQFLGVLAIPLSISIASTIIMITLGRKMIQLLKIKIDYKNTLKTTILLLFCFIFLEYFLIQELDSWFVFLKEIVLSGLVVLIVEILFFYSFIFKERMMTDV